MFERVKANLSAVIMAPSLCITYAYLMCFSRTITCFEEWYKTSAPYIDLGKFFAYISIFLLKPLLFLVWSLGMDRDELRENKYGAETEIKNKFLEEV